MTIIIGLLGPAGAGKSSAAAYLERMYDAKRYSLASPLKEIAKKTLSFSDEQLYGTQEQKEAEDPRYGFSARWFLQRLGTEGCRDVLGANVWVSACLDKIKRDHPHLAVIEDVRFRNEVDAIRGSESGRGFVWRLVPPPDEETANRARAIAHASEREWATAFVDMEIAPDKRGLDELNVLVSRAAYRARIFPRQRPVSL